VWFYVVGEGFDDGLGVGDFGECVVGELDVGVVLCYGDDVGWCDWVLVNGYLGGGLWVM